MTDNRQGRAGDQPSVPTFNLIDLFAGVGGFTLGFADVSDDPGFAFQPRLMVDNDRAARDVATRNLPHVPFLDRDITGLSGSDVRAAAKLHHKTPVHLLVGGPPCQGFSWLGSRALVDERNVLVLDFLRMVRELRPLAVVIENVPLVFTSHDGAIIHEVIETLSGMGYSSIADVLVASDYGVPQQRKRAIVIGYRSDLGLVPRMPVRTHERFGHASDLMEDGPRTRFEPDRLAYVSVEDAIGDLPALGAGEGDEVAFYSRPARASYQQWARTGSVALFNHKSRSHSKDFLEKLSVIEEGGRNFELPDHQRFSDTYYSQAYARLHRNGIAQTITTSFGNPGSGRFIHYRDLRAITVREAARLQSFKDQFVFGGPFSTQMRHVGNAVPPLMARAIRTCIGEDLVSAGAHLEGKNGRQVPARQREHAEARSRIMRAVKSADSGPEVKFRKGLTARGLRGYRLHRKDLPGTPDVVYSRAQLALFIDGCFWHGCPDCRRAPNTRQEYWEMKVERNAARDRRNEEQLRTKGWRVLRFWEHQINGDLESTIKVVEDALRDVASSV